LKVLLRAKRVSVDLWVKKVVPSLTALLPVSLDTENIVEGLSNFLPLLSTLVRNNPKELVIFFLLPLGFGNQGFVSLVPFILALSIVTAGNQLCHILPII
jgi:hypothetical protein